MNWNPPALGSLGILARRPLAGSVKSRIARDLGDLFAAQLYEAMLLDLLDLLAPQDLRVPGGRRVIAFDPPESGEWFDSNAPAAFALRPQVGGGLGERMVDFFEGEFEAGVQSAVLIGSDSPTLDTNLLVSAFLCLDQNDVVIGPAFDGGYYLIGMRRPQPRLFEGVDWGSARVLAQTLERMEHTGLRLALLPPWYDVDTIDDVRFLSTHLKAMRRSGMDPGLPRLDRMLEKIEAIRS